MSRESPAGRLSEADRERVNARVAEAESRVGGQIVTAVVAKSDVYPEIPWKAFALATALASLAVAVTTALRPDWTTLHGAWLQLAAVLAAGLLAAGLTVGVPGLARWLLDGIRAEAEVRQYAQGLFLDRELFRTRARVGVLLLVSLFERQVVVLPDRGLPAEIGDAEWREVVTAMRPLLTTGRTADALIQGVARVETLLAAHGMAPRAPGGDELPDAVIEERPAP